MSESSSGSSVDLIISVGSEFNLPVFKNGIWTSLGGS